MARLLMPYNVSLNQYFEFFTTTDHTRRKLQLVQYIPPPHFKKRGCSRISFVLHCSGKYYAKQPLLKVNWTDFWKLFVSCANFQTWFISEPPRSPPKHLRRKSQRSKNLCIIVLYNFCFNTFFINTFLKKLFPKNQNLTLHAPQKRVKIGMGFMEVQEYWNTYATVT